MVFFHTGDKESRRLEKLLNRKKLSVRTIFSNDRVEPILLVGFTEFRGNNIVCYADHFAIQRKKILGKVVVPEWFEKIMNSVKVGQAIRREKIFSSAKEHYKCMSDKDIEALRSLLDDFEESGYISQDHNRDLVCRNV